MRAGSARSLRQQDAQAVQIHMRELAHYLPGKGLERDNGVRNKRLPILEDFISRTINVPVWEHRYHAHQVCLNQVKNLKR